jgi:hypothetical protein
MRACGLAAAVIAAGLFLQSTSAASNDQAQTVPTEIEELMLRLLCAEMERDVAKVAECYAEHVEFYDHGQVSKNFIRDDKAAWNGRSNIATAT